MARASGKRASGKQLYEWCASLREDGYQIDVQGAYGGYQLVVPSKVGSGIERTLTGFLSAGDAKLWLDGFATAASQVRKKAKR